MYFSPISFTSCLMEGRKTSCFQEARDSVLLSFLSEIKSLHAVRNLFFNFHAHLNLRIHSFAFNGTTLHRTHLAGPNVQWENHCWLPVPFLNIHFFKNRTLFLHLYRSEHILSYWKRKAYTHYPKQVNFGKHCNRCSKKTGKQKNLHQFNPKFAQNIT